MLSFPDKHQADIIEAFNSMSRYLDDLLNIENEYFEQMVDNFIQRTIGEPNTCDTESPFCIYIYRYF